MKLIILAATLAFVGAPVWAQTSGGNVKAPSAQNSGAGIAGQPGNKNGPAPQQTTIGAGINASSEKSVREQDPAKIPGKAGGKSGPAQAPSSQGDSK